MDASIIMLAVGALALVAVAVMYNRLVRSQMRTLEAWSGIDVQLKRRSNLIPNLVQTVRGYAAHERSVFEEVTQARSALSQARGPGQSTEANIKLTQALGHLFALAENYPELRASENFLYLQGELSDIEEKIAYARQFYNRNVLAYNTRIHTIPYIVVAQIFRFSAAEFFEAGEPARSAVRVSFDSQGE
jgi:LemA protein